METLPWLASSEVLQRERESWTLMVGGEKRDEPVKLSFSGGLAFGRVGEPSTTAAGELTLADRTLLSSVVAGAGEPTRFAVRARDLAGACSRRAFSG